MALVPGKLYKTIDRFAVWQYEPFLARSRDDDTQWSVRQIVDPDHVMMFVRSLAREQGTRRVILELVDQDGVMCRTYLTNEVNFTDFFEEVEP